MILGFKGLIHKLSAPPPATTYFWFFSTKFGEVLVAVAVADCHYHNRPSLKVYILDQIICHFLNYHKKYFLLLHVLPLSIFFSFFKWKKIIILKLLAKIRIFSKI